MVPFEKGDFVYLSTKNITFSKGLAQNLIPKYIGPYKIIQDYYNQSYKLELPMHLKRRGMHDVFHSSLLIIHMPNVLQLFTFHFYFSHRTHESAQSSLRFWTDW